MSPVSGRARLHGPPLKSMAGPSAAAGVLVLALIGGGFPTSALAAAAALGLLALAAARVRIRFVRMSATDGGSQKTSWTLTVDRAGRRGASRHGRAPPTGQGKGGPLTGK